MTQLTYLKIQTENANTEFRRSQAEQHDAREALAALPAIPAGTTYTRFFAEMSMWHPDNLVLRITIGCDSYTRLVPVAELAAVKTYAAGFENYVFELPSAMFN